MQSRASRTSVRIMSLAAMGLTACRLLVGIDDPQLVPDGGAVDASFDVRIDTGFDSGFDAGRDTGTDGGCVMCGSECVFTNTDIRHCGACDSPCSVEAPSTVTCALGRCVATLASTTGTTATPIVQGTDVYFANTVANTLSKVPKNGGSPTTLVTGDAGVMSLIAVDNGSIYWTTGDYRIWSASSIDGASPAPLTPPFGPVVGAIVGDTALYFASGSTLRSLDIHGGDPLTIATASSTISSLTADATSFYFTDDSGNVSSVPRAGGTPTKIAFGQSLPTDIAVSSTDAYWLNNSYTLMRVPLGGGAYTQLLTNIDHIKSDGFDLFGHISSSGLVRIPLAGASPLVPVVIGPSTATPQAMDANAIYWTETTTGVGKVMKLSPK